MINIGDTEIVADKVSAESFCGPLLAKNRLMAGSFTFSWRFSVACDNFYPT